MNGKSKIMSCDQCEFTSSSKTLLTKHIHDNHQKENKQEMRKRLKCEKCDYKTTSKESLTKHTETCHEIKEKTNSKRKICNICGKRFNKTTTFNTHMRNSHKEGQVP